MSLDAEADGPALDLNLEVQNLPEALDLESPVEFSAYFDAETVGLENGDLLTDVAAGSGPAIVQHAATDDRPWCPQHARAARLLGTPGHSSAARQQRLVVRHARKAGGHVRAPLPASNSRPRSSRPAREAVEPDAVWSNASCSQHRSLRGARGCRVRRCTGARRWSGSRLRSDSCETDSATQRGTVGAGTAGDPHHATAAHGQLVGRCRGQGSGGSPGAACRDGDGLERGGGRDASARCLGDGRGGAARPARHGITTAGGHHDSGAACRRVPGAARLRTADMG